MAWKSADGQAALEIRRQADLNDARKRGRSPSADRRRGWARGGLPRTASPRAPPPEARRAEERGRTPRRTPPIFTPRATPEAEASERQRASSTRSPAVDPDHEVCRDDGGARKGQPRRRLPTTKGVGTGGGAGAEAGAAITRAAPAARGQRSGAFTRLWRVAPRGKGGRPPQGGPRSGGV